nr:DUF1801 domain-containing protein [Lysinibacter cavernae]
MKERAKELKAAENEAEWERDVLEKISEMPPSDRSIATKIHEIVAANAPQLKPKTWYGMPGYAKDGKIVCFFQASEKFKTRYSTLGFNDIAELDDGSMWPTAYAITKLTPANEAAIATLVSRAAAKS